MIFSAATRFSKRLDGGDLLVPPAPGGNGDLVRMHREGETGRAAGLRDDADHVAEFGDLGAVPAKLDRNGRLDEAGSLECLVVVGDEAIVFVSLRRLGCESGRKPAGGLDDGFDVSFGFLSVLLAVILFPSFLGSMKLRTKPA